MSTQRSSGILSHFAVILVYFLIFTVLTFPLILHPGSVFLGSFSGYGDMPWEIWLQWFVSESIKSGESFLRTDLTHFPFGISIFQDTGYFFVPLLAFLPSIFFNQAVSYNFTVLILTVFSAFAGYLLVKEIARSRPAGLLGGFIFGFSPYALNEFIYGRLPEGLVGFVALYVLCLWRLKENQKKTTAVLAAVFLFLTMVSSFTYGIFSLIFTGLFFLYWGCSWRPFRIDLVLSRRFLLLFFAFLLVASPLIGLYLYRVSLPISGAGQELLFLPEELPDLRVINNSLNFNFPFRSGWKFKVPKQLSPLTLALSALSLLVMPKKARFWIFSALFFYILSLGPYLKASSGPVTIGARVVPLPGLLLYRFFPYFSRVAWPYRFIIFITLPLSVLAGDGFKWIAARCARHRGDSYRLLFLVLILLLGEMKLLSLVNLFPFSLTRAAIPEFYRQLAEEEGDFAIIQYPFIEGEWAYYQTVHQKKMFNGQANLTKRFPPGYREFIENNVFLNSLSLLEEKPDSELQQFDKESVLSLEKSGFRYLVIHNRDEFVKKVAERLKEIFGKGRDYPGDLIVYRLEDPGDGLKK